MNVTATTSAPSLQPTALAAPGRGDSFQQVLATADGPLDDQTLRETAIKFVSSALVLPVLQSLRDSSLSPDGPMAPGPGERRFGPLLDTHLADRITRGARFALVDAVVDSIQTSARREVIA